MRAAAACRTRLRRVCSCSRLLPRAARPGRSLHKARIVFVALLAASSALGQQRVPELRGTWTATSGSQTFRGSWGAEISGRTGDAGQGWWTLLSESGERVMEGTWSARRTPSRWHGTWTARVANGASFSGSWDADETESKDKTFADLLTRTLVKEVSGSWRSGRLGGNWWLRGSRPKGSSR